VAVAALILEEENNGLFVDRCISTRASSLFPSSLPPSLPPSFPLDLREEATEVAETEETEEWGEGGKEGGLGAEGEREGWNDVQRVPGGVGGWEGGRGCGSGVGRSKTAAAVGTVRLREIPLGRNEGGREGGREGEGQGVVRS